jgi:hypothetical protein
MGCRGASIGEGCFLRTKRFPSEAARHIRRAKAIIPTPHAPLTELLVRDSCSGVGPAVKNIFPPFLVSHFEEGSILKKIPMNRSVAVDSQQSQAFDL